MTIGDVLAMIAGVTLLCVSLWALLVGGNLLFARRAEIAHARLENAPLRTLATGVAMVTIGGVGGVVFIGQPNGALKLFGWVLLLGLLAIGALGGLGVVRLAGERVRKWELNLSEFAALRHGALLVVVAAVTPLIGWFVVVPLLLLSSLGAGYYALRQREKIAVMAPVETNVAEADVALLEPIA